MTRRISAMAAITVILLTPSAWAADIFTPVLTVSSVTSESMECIVLNTGTTIVSDVTISIHDAGAGATSETGTFTFAGGAARSVVETSLPGSGNFYCRVSGISKSKAKVTLCLRDANDNCTVAVTAP